jgi:glycosyltransferase involved in cell wall biosynthesis
MNDGSSDMKKILLITNIPNAYRIPLFNELMQQLRQQDMELVVVFAASGYNRRKSIIDLSDCRFRYIILNSEAITPGNDPEKTYFSYKGLYTVLKKEDPYRIIVSGFSAAAVKVWCYAFLNRKKYIIWSGAVLKQGRNDSLMRTLLRKFLVKRAAAFIAYGSLAARYLQHTGAKTEKITIGINTVDTQFFAEQTAGERKKITDDGIRHLLFTGYLVPRKKVSSVLKVAARLAALRNDFCIDIVGDGDERTLLQEQVKQQKLQDFVKFHGFKQKNELPAYMARCSIFLFQTGFDIWGLTLNEAMAAGLPCIASINAGAAADLIIQGKTGFALDYEQLDEVVNVINQLLDDPELAKKTGQAAAAYITEHATLKQSAGGFVNAVLLSGKN